MADDTESLHDPNWFQFAGPIFVVAPYPRPEDYEKLLLSFAQVKSVGSDGTPHWSVALFSDLDLAQRLVESLGPEGAHQKPLAFASLDTMAEDLCALLALGRTHVGIDPGGGTRVVRIDIPRMVNAIRNRKR